MVKTAELELVKIAAFQDEFEKLGGPVGLIAKLLTKGLPKLLMRGAKAVGGKAGAKFLMKSEGVIGSTYRGLRGVAKGSTNMNARKIFGQGIDRAAAKFGKPGLDFAGKGGLKNMEASATKATGGKPVQATNMFGARKDKIKSALGDMGDNLKPGKLRNSLGKVPVAEAAAKNADGAFGAIRKATSGFGRGAVGEVATNIQRIKDKGFGNFLKHTVQKSRTYAKEVTVGGVKETHRFKRSIGGQIGNVATSAPVWAAGALLPSTDSKGKKTSLTKRVGNAAMWGIAPKAAIAKELAGAVL